MAQNAPPADRRNICFFVLGTLTLSIAGGSVMAMDIEAGGLIFILSPAVIAIGLRAFAGDGWSDAGFVPNLKGNIGHYAQLIGLFPLAFVAVGVVSVLCGTAHLQAGFGPHYLKAVAALALPALFFSLSEEIGWRGYLHPRLGALGLSPVRRDLVVAAVWAAWHIPYYAVLQDFPGMPLWQFASLFVIGTYVMTVVFGAVRHKTQSIWPIVLTHAVVNILSVPLLDHTIIVVEHQALLGPRPDSIAVILMQLAFLRWIGLKPARNGAHNSRLR